MGGSGVCAVVGVGPGIGLAVARRFAREGFAVALVARRPEALAEYAEAVREAGAPRVVTAPADAGSAGSLAEAFDHVRAQVGNPTVLVYNPAALHPGPPSQLDPADFVADLRVNAAGALACAQEVLPAMRERGQGTLLFTGGGLALHPAAAYASLSVGKAALRALVLTLAEELAPEGIHVATVTVAGFVQPGTRFDPDAIAETYWQLHTQPRDAWEREVVFS